MEFLADICFCAGSLAHSSKILTRHSNCWLICGRRDFHFSRIFDSRLILWLVDDTPFLAGVSFCSFWMTYLFWQAIHVCGRNRRNRTASFCVTSKMMHTTSESKLQRCVHHAKLDFYAKIWTFVIAIEGIQPRPFCAECKKETKIAAFITNRFRNFKILRKIPSGFFLIFMQNLNIFRDRSKMCVQNFNLIQTQISNLITFIYLQIDSNYWIPHVTKNIRSNLKFSNTL